MSEMKNFTTLTIDMMKKEKLSASQGGPIIIALIENEYGNVQSYYGDAGKAYMNGTAEDLAFSVAIARFFQTGGTFQNYNMYHGRTNFGRTAAAYIITTYDYDAPLDEYSNLNQPKWPLCMQQMIKQATFLAMHIPPLIIQSLSKETNTFLLGLLAFFLIAKLKDITLQR
ncbi:unnamed protein product [Prunus brigantina]